jgi:hypothetical protein
MDESGPIEKPMLITGAGTCIGRDIARFLN